MLYVFIEGKNINLDNLSSDNLTGWANDTEIALLHPEEAAPVSQQLLNHEDQIIFLSAQFCSSPEQIQALVQQLQAVQYGVITTRNLANRTGTLKGCDIFRAIEASESINFVGCCIPAQHLGAILEILEEEQAPFNHFNACLSLLVLTTVGDSGCTVETYPRATSLKIERTLTRAEKSLLLRLLIQCCNIEEIFPLQAWEATPEESAAAAYHDLAALLLKLGETSAALQCLEISDQFQESPRSFVMRGVIASQKGDTLAAVANIVSSLQQYEQIIPQQSLQSKVEVSVTECLQKGLEALNKQDNLLAYNKFAEAINTYDSYFEQKGIVALFQEEP